MPDKQASARTSRRALVPGAGSQSLHRVLCLRDRHRSIPTPDSRGSPPKRCSIPVGPGSACTILRTPVPGVGIRALHRVLPLRDRHRSNIPPQKAGDRYPSDDPSQMDRDQLAPYSEPQCSGLAAAHCTESCDSGVYASVAVLEPMPVQMGSEDNIQEFGDR